MSYEPVWTAQLHVLEGNASGQPQPASITIDSTALAQLAGEYLWLSVDGGAPLIFEVPAAPASSWPFNTLNGYPTLTATNLPGAVRIDSLSSGVSATLHLRGGNYGVSTMPVYVTPGATGREDAGEYLDSRTYIWTWLNRIGGFDFESAPSAASAVIDVNDGQTATISGLPATPPAGYAATHKRIYRATAGVFLFVAEIPATQVSYVDSKAAESLGEEVPTALWAPPPTTLQGIINLNSGILAAFSGRDVYFCEPFHPHAWPEAYAVTVEYPIVGLGRTDATLVVLTTGNPVFIHGTHPAAMQLVHSDIQQSCVSKRSIVSYGDTVFYASPDGLVKISPAGSSLCTDLLFDRTQWQTMFSPSSIHAYQQDGQYVAFYDNGVTQGGFTYDTKSGQFVTHDMYAESGYADLESDRLYLAFGDGTVKKWAQGTTPKAYTWRSKRFTYPQPVGFSVAQVEAEAYNITMKVYGDGVLRHTKAVTSRDPFRLPSGRYRDWEVQLEGIYEVFSVALATSPSELASD